MFSFFSVLVVCFFSLFSVLIGLECDESRCTCECSPSDSPTLFPSSQPSEYPTLSPTAPPIRISLFSWGFEDPWDYGTRVIVSINRGDNLIPERGSVSNIPRGFGMAIINPNNKFSVEVSDMFDTHAIEADETRMNELLVDYINKNTEYIVCIVVRDAATTYSDTIINTLMGLGLYIDAPDLREAFIFVGSTKGKKIWTYSEKRPKGQGPLKRTIVLDDEWN